MSKVRAQDREEERAVFECLHRVALAASQHQHAACRHIDVCPTDTNALLTLADQDADPASRLVRLQFGTQFQRGEHQPDFPVLQPESACCDRSVASLSPAAVWQARPSSRKGDPGPAGPAHVVVRSGGSTVANGASGSATAQCQAGEIATGGGAQIGNANAGNGGAGGIGGNGSNGGTVGNVGVLGGTGGTAAAGGVGGNGGVLGGNGGNTGASNGGFANTGTPASGSTGAAYLTGSAPNTTQSSATGWTGSVTNLSGSDQSFTVWVLCAS